MGLNWLAAGFLLLHHLSSMFVMVDPAHWKFRQMKQRSRDLLRLSFLLCYCWISQVLPLRRKYLKSQILSENHQKWCLWFPPPLWDIFHTCAPTVRAVVYKAEASKEFVEGGPSFSWKWNCIKAGGRRKREEVGRLWKSLFLPCWVVEQRFPWVIWCWVSS